MQVTQRNGLETNNSKTLDIHQLWSRYLAYWPLFLLFLSLAVAGAWIYLNYYTVPLYESTARILIKDETKGTQDSKTIEDLNRITIKKIIDNEIEVIHSRTLVSEVVKNLYLYAPVYEQKGIRLSTAYTTSPVKIEIMDPNSLKETGNVPFSLDDKTSQIIINNRRYPLNQWVFTPYGNVRFVPNNQYKSINKNQLYFSLIDPKSITLDIVGRLTVTSASKLSTILDLRVLDEVPQRGQDILDELMQTYNKSVINDKNALAKNTLSFVEDRLKNVAYDLDSIERRLQNYKSSRGAVDITTQGRLFLENVSSNDQRVSEINMQLAVLNQVEDYVYSKNNKGGIVPSTLGVNDPVLSQLLEKLYVSELQYIKMKKTTGENNPLMVSVFDQIEKIKPSIAENIEGQRRSLEASKRNLASTNGSYSSMLQTIPTKERELIDINREHSNKNEIYNFLLKKREETALSYASTVFDSKIVEKADSSGMPVSPARKKIYVWAIVGALILTIGLITAKETFNSKVLFRHEIESLTAHRIVGELAFHKSKNPIVTGQGKKTLIAEQFRKLRSALNFTGINGKRKRILVTSSIEGEGKSFVAANLALSLALTGKKVILLELDLNNPSLCKNLNIYAEVGIIDYLLGNKDPDELIRRTEEHENLFLMPAGQLPQNSSELLMNGRLNDLLTYLDALFDFIIMDTSPVEPVTDAYILTTYCDTTLYVIRHGYTPKVLVQRMDENNEVNHLNNIAIVFNGVRSRGFLKNDYGYGYGNGYTYNEKRSRNLKRTQIEHPKT